MKCRQIFTSLFLCASLFIYAVSPQESQKLKYDKELLERVLKDPSSISTEALESLIKRISAYEYGFIAQHQQELTTLLAKKKNTEQGKQNQNDTSQSIQTVAKNSVVEQKTTVSAQKHVSQKHVHQKKESTPQRITNVPKEITVQNRPVHNTIEIASPVQKIQTYTTEVQNIITQFDEIKKQIAQTALSTDLSKKIFPDYAFYDTKIYELEKQYLVLAPSLSQEQITMLDTSYHHVMNSLSHAVLSLCIQSINATVAIVKEQTETVETHLIAVDQQQQKDFIKNVIFDTENLRVLKDEMKDITVIMQQGVLQKNLPFTDYIYDADQQIKQTLIEHLALLINAKTAPDGSFNRLIATWHTYFTTVFQKYITQFDTVEMDLIADNFINKIIIPIILATEQNLFLLTSIMEENLLFQDPATVSTVACVHKKNQIEALFLGLKEQIKKNHDFEILFDLFDTFQQHKDSYMHTMTESEFTLWNSKASTLIAAITKYDTDLGTNAEQERIYIEKKRLKQLEKSKTKKAEQALTDELITITLSIKNMARTVNIAQLSFADYSPYDHALDVLYTHAIQLVMSDAVKTSFAINLKETSKLLSKVVINQAEQSVDAMLTLIKNQVSRIQKTLIEASPVQNQTFIMQHQTTIESYFNEIVTLRQLYDNGIIYKDLLFKKEILGNASDALLLSLKTKLARLINAKTVPEGSLNQLIAAWHDYFVTIFPPTIQSITYDDTASLVQDVQVSIRQDMLGEVVTQLYTLSNFMTQHLEFDATTVSLNAVYAQLDAIDAVFDTIKQQLEKQTVEKILVQVQEKVQQKEPMSAEHEALQEALAGVKKQKEKDTETQRMENIATIHTKTTKQETEEKPVQKKGILADLEDLDTELPDAITAINDYLANPPKLINRNAWLEEIKALARTIKNLDQTEGAKYEAIIQDTLIQKAAPIKSIK